MAFDIDYAGFWRRAQRMNFAGVDMLTLAPEDELVSLSIHGGNEMWWSIKWACDTAALVGSHPHLDWMDIVERAKDQGCLRMVLLATSLVRRYFDSAIPDRIIALEKADPILDGLVERVFSNWLADGPAGRLSNSVISSDRLRLHDGVVQRARYVARTLLLPSAGQIVAMPLPRASASLMSRSK
jgi:hypothetical protein